jgi:hypothetical protein
VAAGEEGDAGGEGGGMAARPQSPPPPPPHAAAAGQGTTADEDDLAFLAPRLSEGGWAGAVIASVSRPSGGAAAPRPGRSPPSVRARVAWPDGFQASVPTAVLQDAGPHTAAALIAYYESRITFKAGSGGGSGGGKKPRAGGR